MRRVVTRPFRDTITLELHTHGQYRVAVWPATTRLRVGPSAHPADSNFAPRVREGTSTRATSIELYVQEDGAHAITVAPPPGADSVIVWIWESASAEVAAKARHDRRVGIGLSIETGIVSGYSIADSLPPQASPYFEAGVLIGSDGRFSVLLGGGNDPRRAGVLSVNWGFAELRARVSRTIISGHEFEFTLAARASQGNATTVGDDPSAFGGGVLATLHLDHRRGARGWLIGAHATWLSLRNIPITGQSIGRYAITISWLP